jgi:hypothetical protein
MAKHRLRTILSLLTLFVTIWPAAVSPAIAHQAPAPHPLPDPTSLGSGWSLLPEQLVEEDGKGPFVSAAGAAYVGPEGARAIVVALNVVYQPDAQDEAWLAINELFDETRLQFEFDVARETELARLPGLPGCESTRRLDGREELFHDLPIGMTICAANAPVIVLAYVLGAISGRSGIEASDSLVALVLERAAYESATVVP